MAPVHHEALGKVDGPDLTQDSQARPDFEVRSAVIRVVDAALADIDARPDTALELARSDPAVLQQLTHAIVQGVGTSVGHDVAEVAVRKAPTADELIDRLWRVVAKVAP